MLDLAAFLVRHPEFNPAPTATIEAKLADAALLVDATLYGDLQNAAHGFLTAHMVCLAPGGQFARLVSKEGETTYNKQYLELRSIVTCAIRTF